MAAKRRRKATKQEYLYLCLRVESYEASVDAGINHVADAPHLAWDLDDRDSVYQFTSLIRVTAKLTYPEERPNDTYELTFYSNDAPSRRLGLTLRDVQNLDKHGAPQYRTYRGKLVPVYSPPKGLGLLDKVRGEPRWTGWIAVTGHFANDLLTLLAHKRQLYIGIQERADGRTRWARSISIQTDDPARVA